MKVYVCDQWKGLVPSAGVSKLGSVTWPNAAAAPTCTSAVTEPVPAVAVGQMTSTTTSNVCPGPTAAGVVTVTVAVTAAWAGPAALRLMAASAAAVIPAAAVRKT